MERKSCKRPWRKLVKKMQRKLKRQKMARERENEWEKDKLEKLKDPLYKSWLEQQEEIEQQTLLAEENQRQEQEELWLRRELLAQKQFKRDELKRQAEEAKLEAERLKEEEKLKLLEEIRQQKQIEIKLQAEKAAKEFDNIMISMHEYLDDRTMKTPARLDCCLHSRPGEKSCDFFDKTNCCRYGPACTFNHKRPLLAKIILIKHFFQHPLLELQEHEEYSRSDSELELNERDLRDSYDEFCEDVWPVLEEFGDIINFRTVRNVQAHLKGHVFVEYADKRSALKAFTNLQNRYYASKRLSVEFSNLQQWRAGVCGMRLDFLKGLSLDRKCPKGVKCNFLHLMKNINNKYNMPIYNTGRSSRSVSNSTRAVKESPIISWNSEDTLKNKSLHSRHWRWSESPEIELKTINIEENYKIKSDTENINLPTKHSQRKSCRRSRSNSPYLCYKNAKQLLSNTPNSYKDRNSINSIFKSPRLQHRESKGKSSASEQQDSKGKRKSKHKRKKSKKSKSQRRSSSPNLHYHKDIKRTRSKTPSTEEKQRSRKKTYDVIKSPNRKKSKRSK